MPHLPEEEIFGRESPFEEAVRTELESPRFRYYALSGGVSNLRYVSGNDYSVNLSMNFHPVVFRGSEALAVGTSFSLNQTIQDEGKDKLGDELVAEKIRSLTMWLDEHVQGLEINKINGRVLFDTHRFEGSFGQRRASSEVAARAFANMHAVLEK